MSSYRLLAQWQTDNEYWLWESRIITYIIRRIIKRKRWKIKTYAKRIGYTLPNPNELRQCGTLSGYHNFSLKTLAKLQTVLGVQFLGVRYEQTETGYIVHTNQSTT